MIYEAQSRETISDPLKIDCVIAGMGQNSMREHLVLSATKCDSWTHFVREIESIEHARKTITAPTISRKLPPVREIRTHCERMSKFEPWRSREASMCAIQKETSWTVLDTGLHIIPQRPGLPRHDRHLLHRNLASEAPVREHHHVGVQRRGPSSWTYDMNARTEFGTNTRILASLRQEQGPQNFFIPKNERMRQRPFDEA